MADTATPGRVVRHLSVAYFVPFTNPDGNKAVLVRTARRGELIDPSSLANGEEKRLEDLGALLPAGSRPQDAQAETDAILDAYRGQRGDTDALERHNARVTARASAGGIVDVDAPVDGSAGELAAYLRENRLNVDDTVALAEGDPERAGRVLEAEEQATGGSPRAGVVAGLQKIIGG